MLTPPEFKSEQRIHSKIGELSKIASKARCIFSAKILDRNVSLACVCNKQLRI